MGNSKGVDVALESIGCFSDVSRVWRDVDEVYRELGGTQVGAQSQTVLDSLVQPFLTDAYPLVFQRTDHLFLQPKLP